MKIRTKYEFIFQCDYCDKIAGKDDYEDRALDQAREVARREGWKWVHPHWGLVCPDCLQIFAEPNEQNYG